MSSSSDSDSFLHDDSEDDADFSPASNRGCQHKRSASRGQNLDIEFSKAKDPAEPKTQAEEPNEDEPVSSQNRWERFDGLLQDLNPSSLDQYTKFLEQAHNYLPIGNARVTKRPYPATQVGAVIWRPKEKETMYGALARKGKNGIRQIAATIGTKSELEVVDYLKLLHRLLKRHHIRDEKIKSVVLSDIPAAVEVSEECCDELDKYAEAAVMREDLDLEKKSRLKYVDNALICDVEAKNLVAMDENPPLHGSLHLAANLLNVPGWTRLPALFFMNFGGIRADDSWHNIVQSRRETPGIYGDALMDFYAITMSITRRLIQSSIFIAMARLRSMSRINRVRTQAVRKKDVRSALDVLNMKHGRAGFFVGAARRNHLTILDDSNGKEPRCMTYDEAEKALRRRRGPYGPKTDNEDFQSELDDQVNSSTPKAEQSQSNTDVSSMPRPNQPRGHRIPWEKIPLDPEEEHADLLDLEKSRRQETKLWELLETPAPSRLTKPISAGRKPRAERKFQDDLADWRDRTLYRSEWEEYGDGMKKLKKELASNRRKRRWSTFEVKTELDIKRPRRPRKKRKKREEFKSAEVVVDSSDEDEVETPGRNVRVGDLKQDPIQLDDDDDGEEDYDDHMELDEESSPAPSVVDKEGM